MWGRGREGAFYGLRGLGVGNVSRFLWVVLEAQVLLRFWFL